MKIVINDCFGGFGLSKEAYAKLIEWGVPVRTYAEQKRGADGLYLSQQDNDGLVIFDNIDSTDKFASLSGRYWDMWTSQCRNHPLVVRVVEELGAQASGRFAKLKVVEIPDDVEWEIAEYDGNEHVAEKHRTWS